MAGGKGHELEEPNQKLEVSVRATADSFTLRSHRCARRTAISVARPNDRFDISSQRRERLGRHVEQQRPRFLRCDTIGRGEPMITITEQDYNDIMQGKTGNGIAEMIPSILKEKMAEGYKVYLTDEAGRLITQLVCTEG